MRTRKPPRTLEVRAKSEGISPHGCNNPEKLEFWVQYKKTKKPTIFKFEFLRRHFGKNSFKGASKLNELWAMGAKATARNRHISLSNFFRSIGNSEASDLAPLEKALIENSDAFEEWQSAVADWAGAVKARHAAKPRTAGQTIANVNRGLAVLQGLRLFPHVSLSRIPRNAHKRASRRVSLAQQISPQGTVSQRIGDLVEQLSSRFADPEDKKSAKTELLVMAEVLGEDLPTSPEGLLAALEEVQRSCITTIENIASDIFRQWQCQYEKRDEYLRSAHTAIADRLWKAINGDQSSQEWFTGFGGTFTKNELIGSALQCFIEHYGGIAPSETNSGRAATLRWLYKHAAGRLEFDALLHATPDAVAAAMLLTACETGANPSVLCELSTDLGIKPIPDDPNTYSFEALKKRAGNKFIDSVLRTTRKDGCLPAIAALQTLQTSLDPLRKKLNTDVFFVFRFQDEPSYAGTSFLANRLKYFLRDSGLAAKYKFTPSAIRTCFLMLRSLSKSPDSLIGRHLAGHGEDSMATSRYEFRLEQQVRLSAYARQYHMQAMQFAEARATGNVGADGSSDGDEDDLRFSQFVDLSDDLILDAVLTTTCLERANDDLVKNRRTHWLHVCEPELAWATVLLEKATKSPLAHRVPWAKQEAKRLIDNGFVHHLE